jgi:prenyltransferase beta subunit
MIFGENKRGAWAQASRLLAAGVAVLLACAHPVFGQDRAPAGPARTEEAKAAVQQAIETLALSDPDPIPARSFSEPDEMQRVEAAIDRAIEYLVRKQLPDGSWPSWTGPNNAINAICLLAFLGRGHIPGRGPFQPVVDRAVAFLLATQSPQGLYRSPIASRVMYEHALSTLAMVEAYGCILTPEMRAGVQRGVNVIVSAQNAQGGWRYTPTSADSDLSVTVMQVVALRAAQNARLFVPQETLDRARGFVRACVSAKGGFGYQPGGESNAARAGAGALCLQLLGAYDDPGVRGGLEYLRRTRYGDDFGHFYYGNYYAMQATFQAGGDYWEHWHPQARQWFLRNQNPDGSWPGVGSETQYNAGSALTYSTALGAMCLEVYLHYLPAYQR